MALWPGYAASKGARARSLCNKNFSYWIVWHGLAISRMVDASSSFLDVGNVGRRQPPSFSLENVSRQMTGVNGPSPFAKGGTRGSFKCSYSKKIGSRQLTAVIDFTLGCLYNLLGWYLFFPSLSSFSFFFLLLIAFQDLVLPSSHSRR